MLYQKNLIKYNKNIVENKNIYKKIINKNLKYI